MKDNVLPFTWFQKGMLAVCFVCLLLIFCVIAVLWPEIPEKIPGHYDAGGNVTRYDSKSMIWISPIVSAVLTLGMAVLLWFPSVWNIPVKITEENRKRVLSATRDFVLWMILWMQVDFGCITLGQMGIISLKEWFFPFFLISMLGLMAGNILRLVKTSKAKEIPDRER